MLFGKLNPYPNLTPGGKAAIHSHSNVGEVPIVTRRKEGNNSYTKFRFLVFIALTTIFTTLSISCKKNIDVIPTQDFLTYPSMIVKNFRTVITDSGKMQVEMKSPLLEEYNNKEIPYTEFRHGINVDFWDGKKIIAGSVTAKYAKYTKSANLWELKDSVVVINENKDVLETELLFWNQKEDRIYTDRFFKISSIDQVTQGFGFESDSHLRHRKLKKVSAEIYLNDEE
jgi:LPS export ABC transporter protein LptC